MDQLDGLPLAIELAAARARLLSPTQLLDRLSDRFRLLGGRADDTGRQTTLRGLIDWSWDLLEPWERAAIAQLSVFRNGFFMEAAEAVLDLSAWPEAPWALDVVGSLLDKSLLRSWEVGGLPRFGMYVSIRDYATEQLEQGAASDREALALRSATYYARFGTVEYRDLLNTHGGGRRRQLLALELENLLAGAEVAIGAGDPSVAGGCVLGAWEQFRMAGPFLERAEVLTRVLAMDGLDDLQRMRLLGTRGWLLHLRGQPDEVLEHYEAALAIARTLGDRRWQGVWLGSLGILHRVQGRIPEAKKHYEAALSVARELGDRGREGNWLGDMGSLHRQQGRIPEALDYTMAALSIARELGDRRFEGIQLGRLGSLHKGQGRIPEAREHMEAALAIARELGHRLNEGMQLGNLGDLFLVQDQSEDAGRHFEQAILIGDEALTAMAGAFRGSLALVRAGAGNVPEARALLDRGEEQLRGVDALELAKLQCKRGQVEHRAGKVAVAQAALDEARTISSERGVGPDSELGRAVADLARLLEGVPV